MTLQRIKNTMSLNKILGTENVYYGCKTCDKAYYTNFSNLIIITNNKYHNIDNLPIAKQMFIRNIWSKLQNIYLKIEHTMTPEDYDNYVAYQMSRSVYTNDELMSCICNVANNSQ